MSYDKKILQERRRILLEQPKVKWINVIDTNDGIPKTKRFLVRNTIRDVDQLKSELTNTLQPSQGAMRNIYTPAGGTEITSLDQIQSQRDYVAGAGNNNFRKISQTLRQMSHPGTEANSVASSSKTAEAKEGPPKPKRMTLIERQNLIAQRAKENLPSSLSVSQKSGSSITDQSTRTSRKSSAGPVRKERFNLANRRPLYPVKKRTVGTPSEPKRTGIKAPNDRYKRRVAARRAAKNAAITRSIAKSPPPPNSARSRHSVTSKRSSESQRSIASRSKSPSVGSDGVSRSPSRERSPPARSQRGDSRSRTPSRSGSRSPSRRGSASIRSRSDDRPQSNYSRVSSRRSDRSGSDDRSRRPSIRSGGSRSRSPSREGSVRSRRTGSRSPSPAQSRYGSGGSRSRSPSIYSEHSRSPSPRSSRSRRTSAGSRRSDQSKISRYSRPSSRGSDAFRSRGPSKRGSVLSGITNGNKTRKNSILTIRSRRSRLSSHDRTSRRPSSGGNIRLNAPKSSGRSERSRRSRSPADSNYSRRSDRNRSLRGKSEEIIDSDDGKDYDKRSHRSVRYGSKFSSRSHRMKVSGNSGEGAPNNDANSRTLASPSTSSSIYKASSGEVTKR